MNEKKSNSEVRSGHTRGPWIVNRYNRSKVETVASDKDVSRAIAYSQRSELDHYAARDKRCEAEANARLIAAAPDLLEALRELLMRADALIFRPPVDDSRRIDQDTRELRRALEPARAAIAKAEGRS